jgi:hypothetical protein
MTTTTIEKELVDMERQYWQAIKDKDVNAAMGLSRGRSDTDVGLDARRRPGEAERQELLIPSY